MQKLLSVKDIMARYQCSDVTARKYMREMGCREKPLMVTEKAVEAWDQKMTQQQPERKRRERERPRETVTKVNGKYWVPRVRPV